MAASNSSFIPAPLAHADNLEKGIRGGTLTRQGAFEKSPRSTLLEVSKRLYKRPLRRCSPEVGNLLAVACQTNLQI
ncbi:hypothetical protein TNCV_263301 [Trichonephila clavipes]|nr:hypothetical protein TNCV_263301 [Trichonephila clavipes]